MYRMYFIEGSLKGRQLTVREGSVRVGSGTECDLKLAGADVAPHHATLVYRGGELTLRPETVRGGLTVNGTPVTGEQPVGPGDQIRLGTTVFVLTAGAGSRPQARRRRDVPVHVPVLILLFLVFQALIMASLFRMRHLAPLPPADREDAAEETDRTGPASHLQNPVLQAPPCQWRIAFLAGRPTMRP